MCGFRVLSTLYKKQGPPANADDPVTPSTTWLMSWCKGRKVWAYGSNWEL